jgi:hypothetical protein
MMINKEHETLQFTQLNNTLITLKIVKHSFIYLSYKL